MPLDPMFSESILSSFRNMVDDCRNRGLSGPEFDEIETCYRRLEALAQQHDDMNAFNGQVMQEQLYMKMSDLYGRLLSKEGAAKQEERGYDDATLLKQSVDALRTAVQSLHDSKKQALDENAKFDPKAAFKKTMEFAARNEGKKQGPKAGFMKEAGGMNQVLDEGNKSIDETLKTTPNAYDNSVEIEELIKTELLVKPIEDLIRLGEEPGMTLPRFLRLQIERGLDKAMEGSVVVRDGMEFSYGNYAAIAFSPLYIEREKRKLDLFDKLAAENPFKVPNADELKYGLLRIDYEFEPKIKRWEDIEDRWYHMLDDLYTWSLAYCPFAPMIQPWSLAENPRQAVIDTQKMQPGIFRVREKQLLKYHGIGFHDIFRHETFRWQVENGLIWNSQELVEFLIHKVYPACIPHQNLPQELIGPRGELFQQKREMNPDSGNPGFRMEAFYDSKFGEGRWASKYAKPKKTQTNAAPWNLTTFAI